MASIFDPNNPTAFNLLGNQQQQPFTINQENYQQPNANITASANGMNRNQKIGYMLSALSDAFAGRDVAGRAMGRAQAMRQQAEVDRQRQEAEKRSNIFKSTNRANFAEGTIGDKMYYKDLANNFMQIGDPDTALRFAELAKPVNDVEAKKISLDQNKLEGKEWGNVKKGIQNFRQIIDAAQDDSGAAAYSLMIKYIKNLDDSVVREGEVRTFGNFQGIYQNFLNEFSKAKGEGFTSEIRNNLVQLAQKSVQSLVNDWETYKVNKTNDLYTPLGIDANRVFAGYGYEREVDEQGQPTDVLFKTYTTDDFQDKGSNIGNEYQRKNSFQFR